MITFVIIGALIGAGFASGQEIYLFFYRYGVKGIAGLIVCSVLIGIITYKTFKIILNSKENVQDFKKSKKIRNNKGLNKDKEISNDIEIKNYKDFLDTIFHIDNSRNKYLNLSYITNIIINVFLLMTFFIMISGFGAYFEQEFNISSTIRSGYFSNNVFCSFFGKYKWSYKSKFFYCSNFNILYSFLKYIEYNQFGH